jgi:hypothetical protein
MEPIYLSKGKRFLERASQAVYANLDSLSSVHKGALDLAFAKRENRFSGSGSNVVLNYQGLAKVVAIAGEEILQEDRSKGLFGRLRSRYIDSQAKRQGGLTNDHYATLVSGLSIGVNAVSFDVAAAERRPSMREEVWRKTYGAYAQIQDALETWHPPQGITLKRLSFDAQVRSFTERFYDAQVADYQGGVGSSATRVLSEFSASITSSIRGAFNEHGEYLVTGSLLVEDPTVELNTALNAALHPARDMIMSTAPKDEVISVLRTAVFDALSTYKNEKTSLDVEKCGEWHDFLYVDGGFANLSEAVFSKQDTLGVGTLGEKLLAIEGAPQEFVTTIGQSLYPLLTSSAGQELSAVFDQMYKTIGWTNRSRRANHSITLETAIKEVRSNPLADMLYGSPQHEVVESVVPERKRAGFDFSWLNPVPALANLSRSVSSYASGLYRTTLRVGLAAGALTALLGLGALGLSWLSSGETTPSQASAPTEVVASYDASLQSVQDLDESPLAFVGPLPFLTSSGPAKAQTTDPVGLVDIVTPDDQEPIALVDAGPLILEKEALRRPASQRELVASRLASQEAADAVSAYALPSFVKLGVPGASQDLRDDFSHTVWQGGSVVGYFGLSNVETEPTGPANVERKKRDIMGNRALPSFSPSG